MAAQLPFIVFFALKWLFRETKQAFLVLGLQLGAALAALAPVLLPEFVASTLPAARVPCSR
jgi:hypothetical protein